MAFGLMALLTTISGDPLQLFILRLLTGIGLGGALPSGVVLTSFEPGFAPVLGYQEEIGIDDDNRYESRVYPDNFFEGITEPLFGSATAFTTRIKVTAPEAYTVNSVGSLVSDCVESGRRTVVWASDQPVRFFNVIAGRWKVKQGEGTAVYYDRAHPYNVDEMSEVGESEGEHRQKALPTGEHLAVVTELFEQCDGLIDRVRSVVVEWRHLHCGSPSDRPGLYAWCDGSSFVSKTARGHLEEDQDLVALELAHGGQSGGNRSTRAPSKRAQLHCLSRV